MQAHTHGKHDISKSNDDISESNDVVEKEGE